MFNSYYPQSSYSPFYQQPSPYARALAQQQARARAQQQAEQERLLNLRAQQQRAARSRYLPDGYERYAPDGYARYEPEEENYVSPRQRALVEAQRRQEALEQRKREATQRAAAALKQQHQQQQQPQAEEEIQTTPSRPQTHSQSRSREPSPHASTSTPPPPPPFTEHTHTPEQLDAAATTIQTHYRAHRALHAISQLQNKFHAVKADFKVPTTIDYKSPSGAGVVSVPVPRTLPPVETETAEAKLAYTPTNVPLHTYTELLSRLLVSLDAVESRGDARVRERRRAVVREVEAEAARIESFWRGVWAAHQLKQKEGEEEQEVSTMVTTPELSADEEEDDEIPKKME
ncbi:hypothetical protein FB45DRAFT_930306 [Roridomyces roridus]|uniref:BAG domain-containing protein n=1 Tax=Roridomyces roridus TaxID=1738132 RepID=A0AAD7B0Y4_9AGAR|nr:hypothetical protein FB45DRAFT_948309 [Roridomyces roridus]KAJ7619280.1 hypothetical protein FB45DRAFT_930306 [Roridomyces roridus]